MPILQGHLGHTYHFFSGIGRGTALTRQGKFGWPERFLPRIVPTRFNGRMTKKQIQQTATCRRQNCVEADSLVFPTHPALFSFVFLVPEMFCSNKTSFISNIKTVKL